MKKQWVIITNYANDVNTYLDKGWYVVSVTSSHNTSASGNHFCFIIEKDNQ
jgi:hypothetical protein